MFHNYPGKNGCVIKIVHFIYYRINVHISVTWISNFGLVTIVAFYLDLREPGV